MWIEAVDDQGHDLTIGLGVRPLTPASAPARPVSGL